MRAAAFLLLAGCGLAVADQAPPRPQPGPPLPPTDLTVRIVDRRATSMEVCWLAGAGSEYFDVRYARVPITAEHFDDVGVVARAPFTGGRRPYAAGDRVCQLVTGLYIETGYYFAVRALGEPPPATEPTS
jgi:hypothetical protein